MQREKAEPKLINLKFFLNYASCFHVRGRQNRESQSASCTCDICSYFNSLTYSPVSATDSVFIPSSSQCFIAQHHKACLKQPYIQWKQLWASLFWLMWKDASRVRIRRRFQRREFGKRTSCHLAMLYLFCVVISRAAFWGRGARQVHEEWLEVISRMLQDCVILEVRSRILKWDPASVMK